MGGGSKPKTPKPPPPPPAPITAEDPAVRAAKEAEIRRQQRMRGRTSTVLAGRTEGLNTQPRRTTLGGQ